MSDLQVLFATGTSANTAFLWTDGYYRTTPEPMQAMKLSMIDAQIASIIQQLDEVLEEE